MSAHDIFIRKFTAGIDTNCTCIGWKPNDVKLFDARSGLHLFGVAHDTMEHPVLIDASFDNELMAHGANLYIRPTHIGDRKTIEALIENLVWFYGQIREGKWLPATEENDPLHHASLAAGVMQVVRGVQAEAKLELHEVGTLRTWLQRGYGTTQRRYATLTRQHVEDMFNEITDRVKSLEYVAKVADGLHVSLYDKYVQVEHIEFYG